jgi:hypothetical protein
LENKYTEAYNKLFEAECAYLKANGWKEQPKGEWEPPVGRDWMHIHKFGHGHAVNSQKFWDRERARLGMV